MLAIGVTPSEDLELEQTPEPVPGPGEVLIDVVAAAINNADLQQRVGNYPPPPGASEILGLEVSGRVAALGEGAGNGAGGGLAVGDRVMALLAGGGYAEKVAVPEGQVLRVPGALPLLDAAALPEALCTVSSTVFDAARLGRGETLLVHGGGGGIGTAAIQMAHHAGCMVIVTVGSDAKAEPCRALGADHIINYRDEDFVERIAEITSGRGVDVVLDAIGAGYYDRNVACLADGGRLAIIGVSQGNKVEVSLMQLMQRRASVIGTTLRSRSAADKARVVGVVAERFLPEVEAGRIRPVVDSVFPLADAGAAHDAMRASNHVGKILLAVADES